MNLQLEQQTVKALEWIIEIFNRLDINYQISGGFAGKVFGSKRELHDIDIDISENNFKKILPEISKYIIYGPTRYKDAKWDLELITLNFNGQEIDISGVESMLISNKERTKWLSSHVDFSKVLEIDLNGIKLKIINPKDFVQYKKELDGEHQAEDIKVAQNYLLK
jgi:hypothetical protein